MSLGAEVRIRVRFRPAAARLSSSGWGVRVKVRVRVEVVRVVWKTCPNLAVRAEEGKEEPEESRFWC